VSGVTRDLRAAIGIVSFDSTEEMTMIYQMLKCGAVLGLLLASAGAYADDPTGVLEQQRGTLPRAHGHSPKFSDSGPCQRGMQQESFPNAQGYRCVRKQ
jgi:hypothetical protein